jgi:hypothetical protein
MQAWLSFEAFFAIAAMSGERAAGPTGGAAFCAEAWATAWSPPSGMSRNVTTIEKKRDGRPGTMYLRMTRSLRHVWIDAYVRGPNLQQRLTV